MPLKKNKVILWQKEAENTWILVNFHRVFRSEIY